MDYMGPSNDLGGPFGRDNPPPRERLRSLIYSSGSGVSALRLGGSRCVLLHSPSYRVMSPVPLISPRDRPWGRIYPPTLASRGYWVGCKPQTHLRVGSYFRLHACTLAEEQDLARKGISGLTPLSRLLLPAAECSYSRVIPCLLFLLSILLTEGSASHGKSPALAALARSRGNWVSSHAARRVIVGSRLAAGLSHRSRPFPSHHQQGFSRKSVVQQRDGRFSTFSVSITPRHPPWLNAPACGGEIVGRLGAT